MTVKITKDDPNPETTTKYITKEEMAQAIIKVLLYIIVAGIGAIFAIAYDLNGKIYEAVGKSNALSNAYELEIDSLKNQLKDMKQTIRQRDCLENVQIKDKAGCYND